MSGNIFFEKAPEQFYELVFDFSDQLHTGETIKDAIVYVNNEKIEGTYESRYTEYVNGSGSYNSIFTFDPEAYDKHTILVMINSGKLDHFYDVRVEAISNRHDDFSKDINVFIINSAYPDVYNDFEYRFLLDDYQIYILPALYRDPKTNCIHSTLNYNTEYTVNISKELTSCNGLSMEQDESFWFTSKYCPMFTTATKITFILGPEAEAFTEDTINRYIHRTSKEAIDLMNVGVGCNGKAKIPYDYYGCTPEGVPYNLQRYVECKTAYDLLNLLDRLRLINGTSAGQTKTLGDMTIKYNGIGRSGDNCPSCGPKKDLYDCWMGLQGILSNSPTLCGTGAGINNGVRGKYDVSKGFSHPVFDVTHNRVVKPRPNAEGPWYNTTNFRYPMSSRSTRPRRTF